MRALEWWGVALQVLGSALLLWGLALTWAEWQTEPSRRARFVLLLRRLPRLVWQKLTVRRRDGRMVTGTGSAVATGVTIAGSAVGRRGVPALDAPEQEWREFVAALTAYVDTRFDQSAQRVDQLCAELAAQRESDQQAVMHRLVGLEQLATEQARRAATEGIGTAAVGSLIVLVGTVLAAAG